MRRAALHNLGCKVNAYESEAMQRLLVEAGYEIVPFAKEAEVYIINTCSVTNIADRKSRQMLHRAKKQNPGAVVVAVGCYVQAEGEELLSDEAVDLVIGNNRKAELVGILEDYFERGGRTKKETITDIAAVREYESLSIRETAGHTRAFVKVQDGCNQFCSYCIIPYTRGRVRSREAGAVIEEARALAENGYREIVLTGIHLSSYGIDFAGEGRTDLLDLILRLNEVAGIERIRLGSLEPGIITEAFAQRLAGLEKFCPQFHLSLQSGCDATLKRMNRRYTAEEYWEKCVLLREIFSKPALTTDVIVGFPGETEEEFSCTRDFLEKVRFYEMHVFKYSKRKGTRAAVMEDQVPESAARARSDGLLALDRKLSREYRRSWIGEQAGVLLEEPMVIGSGEFWTGHTREYIKAAVPRSAGDKGVTVRGTLSRFLNDEVLYLETAD